MIYTLVAWGERINEWNEVIKGYVEKFTSNSMIASLGTLAAFLILCMSISYFTKK